MSILPPPHTHTQNAVVERRCVYTIAQSRIYEIIVGAHNFSLCDIVQRWNPSTETPVGLL